MRASSSLEAGDAAQSHRMGWGSCHPGDSMRGSVTSVYNQTHSRQNMDKQPTWLRETQVPEMVSYVQGEFEELMSSPMELLAQGHGRSPSGAASRSDHPSTHH